MKPHRGIGLESNATKQLRELLDREPSGDFEQIALDVEIPLAAESDGDATKNRC